MSRYSVAPAVLAVGVLFAFALVSTMDHQDEQAQQALDCEMAALWNADRERGFGPMDRRGYPIARERWIECQPSTNGESTQ